MQNLSRATTCVNCSSDSAQLVVQPLRGRYGFSTPSRIHLVIKSLCLTTFFQTAESTIMSKLQLISNQCLIRWLNIEMTLAAKYSFISGLIHIELFHGQLAR